MRRGFTLIELMVVMVIVGVLAAIAMPTFLQQIYKGRRAEAITEIYRASQAEERIRATATTYSANVGTGALNLLTPAAAVTPTTAGTISSSEYDMAGARYRIRVSTDSSTPGGGPPTPLNTRAYTIRATAINGALGDTRCRALEMRMVDGVITTVSFNSLGAETNGAQNACWNQ